MFNDVVAKRVALIFCCLFFLFFCTIAHGWKDKDHEQSLKKSLFAFKYIAHFFRIESHIELSSQMGRGKVNFVRVFFQIIFFKIFESGTNVYQYISRILLP